MVGFVGRVQSAVVMDDGEIFCWGVSSSLGAVTISITYIDRKQGSGGGFSFAVLLLWAVGVLIHVVTVPFAVHKGRRIVPCRFFLLS